MSAIASTSAMSVSSATTMPAKAKADDYTYVDYIYVKDEATRVKCEAIKKSILESMEQITKSSLQGTVFCESVPVMDSSKEAAYFKSIYSKTVKTMMRLCLTTFVVGEEDEMLGALLCSGCTINSDSES